VKSLRGGAAIRRGMTLIELLVSIAILGMLVALTLPAINSARERGRSVVCINNLRNLALAALNHESAQGYFPSGGWGGAWVGIPGRGFGPRPGSWGFSLLSYLERSDLAELGRDDPPPQREAQVARLLGTPMAVFNCPTRRQAAAYPIFYAYARRPFGSGPVEAVARSDYAMNCGGQPRCEIASWFKPPSLAAGDDPAYPWPDVADHTGISYLRSQITMAHVRDGASRTYLAGEKHLSVGNESTGADHGDDWSLYTGYQDDMHRSTHQPPARDGDETRTCRFGSMHPVAWHAAFCDASVRGLSYDIDPTVHRSLGHRADGRILDDHDLR
jgi:prepilin-type N-terminal cleavage/methylation domain-containing protein